MDETFWHQKWERNDIPFHENKANHLFVKYFDALSLAKGSRVFVPLCGKTHDIAWLLTQGYRVAGIELSELAIEQLYINLDVQPKITEIGRVKHYQSSNIDIFVGDIFQLSRQLLGSVDAIYDRAALVALPEKLRSRYTKYLIECTAKAPQLLICYEYDQNAMAGPPFSVTNDEVNQHYRAHYALKMLDSVDVPGGLKGQCAAQEKAWLLAKA